MKVAKLICLAAISFCSFALTSHFLAQLSQQWSIVVLLICVVLAAILICCFADAIGEWLQMPRKLVIFQELIIALAAIAGGVLAWIN